jgi:surface antigen
MHRPRLARPLTLTALVALTVSGCVLLWLWWWLPALARLAARPGSRAVWLERGPALTVGGVIDQWRGVPVRYNGAPYTRSWGRHYADDGFYYGQQWQCVEFVKRFYHDRLGHTFPNAMGHAAEFFNPGTPHGTLNLRRGLWQYANGGHTPPALDDIMVWTTGGFGHVAIVSKAGGGFIEVVQQNIGSRTRARLTLSARDGKYYVGEQGRLGAPAGWLRIKER